MDLVTVVIHEHQVQRLKEYNEPWLCSGMQEEGGCLNPSQGIFQPGLGSEPYIC